MTAPPDPIEDRAPATLPAAVETPPPVATRHVSPLRGIGLILLSTVFMAAGDTASKYLTGLGVQPPMISWMRYCVFFSILAVAVAATGGVRGLRTRRPGMQILRGLGVVGSTILFVFALRYLPVADATAASFVAPLFVTALSIPLLGEKVGWRRWTATLVGLLGVLIVVRPGGANFSLASLLPILTASCWAVALIVTRMMSVTENPLTTFAWSAAVGLIVLSGMLPFFWTSPTPEILAVGAFIGVASTIGHWLVILAFRHGEASLLAPFSYMQLMWASLFGFVVFTALPDLWTWVGAAVIAASGLYTAHRERVRAREALRR